MEPTGRRKWQPTPVLLPGKSYGWRSLVGYSPCGHEESYMTEWLHFHFYELEKEMTTYSSVLAWRIPGMGEPGRPLSMGSHRVGHDWSDLAAAAAWSLQGFPEGSVGEESVMQRTQETRVWSRVGKIPWRRKWQPTSVFLPEKSQGQRSLAGYSPLCHKELDTTEWLNTHAWADKELRDF